MRTPVVAAVASPPPEPEDWRDDGRSLAPRWNQEQLLRACDQEFGDRLAAFLAAVPTAFPGVRVRVGNTWRPWWTQADKLRRGVSKVDTSYHNFVTPQLAPAAMAADLDLTVPEGVKASEYREGMGRNLRALALNFGLAMGWFGLGRVARTVENAYALPMGWDPFHIQLLRPPYSIAELRDELQARYTDAGVPPAVRDGETTPPPAQVPWSPGEDTGVEEDPESSPLIGALALAGGVAAAAGVLYLLATSDE